ncbi:type II secretion system F family protein [soil metagenome]
MLTGEQLPQIAFIVMIALAVGGLLFALFYPYIMGSGDQQKRVRAVAENTRIASKPSGLRAMLFQEDAKDSRRKQLQESLNQIEQREKQRKKRMTLRTQLQQAGIDATPRTFLIMSGMLGGILAFVCLFFGVPWYAALGAFVVGTFGLPRWVLSYLRKRRQNTFLNDFADAIDVMVRGLKSGLPITDAMKVISTETPDPVGPEFMEVVEGQRIGITIDQGIERMFDRVPLAEVNFLSIVMNIQTKTGGNLAEALNNLSKVLRDRKKMKSKIKSVSQEAKASAAIIGSLPFCIMAAMTILNPEYLNPMFQTKMGNIMLIGSGVWMGTGILVMRKMINFDF